MFSNDFTYQPMPRFGSLFDSLPARIRRYFGISQEELASYLGLTGAQVSRLEAGKQDTSAAIWQQLDRLATPLPAAEPLPLTAAVLLTLATAPERAPLEARLDYCQHHARRLRRALRPLEAQATYAARWRDALPVLRAGLPPDPGGEEPPVATGPGRWASFLVWYRWRWLALRPTTLSPDEAARYHLLRLQAEALEAEAEALAALLARPA